MALLKVIKKDNYINFVTDSNNYLAANGEPICTMPIGTIYMSTKDVSPAALFGGKWTNISDVFLLGAGSTYTLGGTGGEATHTLTVDEMPSHDHILSSPSSSIAKSGSAIGYEFVVSWTGSGDRVTSPTGGSQAHNNMPPYQVVNIWQRTA